MFNFFRRNKEANPSAGQIRKNRRKAVKKIGREMTEISNKRYGGKKLVLTEKDKMMMAYIFGDDCNYMINQGGLDFPVLDNDNPDSFRITLWSEGYIPVNRSLFIHYTVMDDLDIETYYLYILDDFEKKMSLHLRRDYVHRNDEPCSSTRRAKMLSS